MIVPTGCSRQAIAKAEAVTGNAARLVRASTLCLCKGRRGGTWGGADAPRPSRARAGCRLRLPQSRREELRADAGARPRPEVWSRDGRERLSTSWSAVSGDAGRGLGQAARCGDRSGGARVRFELRAGVARDNLTDVYEQDRVALVEFVDCAVHGVVVERGPGDSGCHPRVAAGSLGRGFPQPWTGRGGLPSGRREVI